MCVIAGAAAAAGAGAMGGIGTAISAITSVASIGLGVMQAQAQHNAAMADYQNKMQMREEQRIQNQKTLNLQVAQHQAALNSERDKAQGEKADNAIRAYKAESRASASAAESGVVGLSVDNLIGSIKGEATRFSGKIDHSAKTAQFNTENALKMKQRGLGAQFASIPIPVKPKFNAGLHIGSAVVSGLTSFGRAMM